MNDSKSQPKKGKEISEKEMNQLSEDLIKKIREANSKKNKRSFIPNVNPIIIAVSLIILFLLGISIFTGRDYSAQKVGIDKIFSDLKENKYSQLLIQNDGKILANSKFYYVANKSTSSNDLTKQKDTKIENVKNNDFETITSQNLISELVNQNDFTNQLKVLFKGNAQIKEILLGDNFVIASRSNNQKDYLVSNISTDEFLNQLENVGISYGGQTPVPIRKLSVYGSSLDSASFSQRNDTDQYSVIYDLGNQYIGKLKGEYVNQYYIDWTASIYSFTDVLQKEGISLSSQSFEIISANIPAGIGLSDILNILMLLGLVVFAFFILRGAQGSGMGIMQFGQSKAKMFFGSKTDTTFKDVAGINEARDELNEIVDFLKNPNKFRKLGARIPKGILMFGPPGTGKTLLARAIAGEAGVPFFHTSGSEFEEMLVGAGASRVRDLFAKAKRAAPSLIFIDEIDAVARKRGTKIQTGATEQTLNQILVEMDGFEKNVNVIVIAATNRPDVLDPAILRPGRFDRQVRIDLPDAEGRKEILEVHAKNKPLGKDVDLEKIGKRTVGFTGADLENILNEAAILAARENKKEINMSDIEEAVSKVTIGPAKKSRKRTDKELKLVAYHEAGHAVVAKFTPNSTPVDKISITSRGSTGGVTMFLPEKDEYIVSKGKLVADITVSLGGRAAEEVALEDISTGASNDIEQATSVAKRMIQRFGMSDRLGLVQYGEFGDSEYLGYGYSESKDYSDKTAELIDEEIRDIVDEAHKNAVRILTEHRDVLDRTANALLEREVLTKEEFDELVG